MVWGEATEAGAHFHCMRGQLTLCLGANSYQPQQQYPVTAAGAQHQAAADRFAAIFADFQQQHAEQLSGSETLRLQLQDSHRKGGVFHDIWQVCCWV
jgi:hypothetical protein